MHRETRLSSARFALYCLGVVLGIYFATVGICSTLVAWGWFA